MLHGLMRGAVLAQADGVVRHHKQGAGMAERGHADGCPHVVCTATKHCERSAMSAVLQSTLSNCWQASQHPSRLQELGAIRWSALLRA